MTTDKPETRIDTLERQMLETIRALKEVTTALRRTQNIVAEQFEFIKQLSIEMRGGGKP